MKLEVSFHFHSKKRLNCTLNTSYIHLSFYTSNHWLINNFLFRRRSNKWTPKQIPSSTWRGYLVSHRYDFILFYFSNCVLLYVQLVQTPIGTCTCWLYLCHFNAICFKKSSSNPQKLTNFFSIFKNHIPQRCCSKFSYTKPAPPAFFLIIIIIIITKYHPLLFTFLYKSNLIQFN